MSTNSRIYLKLKEEDKGKTMQCNPSLFKCNSWNHDTPNVTIPMDANYISIYCHYDGMPKVLGVDLFKYWTEYNDILNMLLAGHTSYIEERNVKPYHAWRGEEIEKWRDTKPDFTKDTHLKENYIYMFDCETNKWYVDISGEFESLEDVLNGLILL